MRYARVKMIIGLVGIAVCTLPTIYLAGYFLRVDVARGPLTTTWAYQSDFEMRLYSPMEKVEEYIREWRFPKAKSSN